MGRPRKNPEVCYNEESESIGCTCSNSNDLLEEIIASIHDRLEKLEAKVFKKSEPATINKVEEHYGEIPHENIPKDNSGFSEADKLFSVLNAIKILPPNLIVDGRHTLSNVQAINARFVVTEEMLDEVYKEFKHDGW